MMLRKTSIHVAGSVSQALSLLGDRGSCGEVLAGATWIMRAPIRGEREPRAYVAIARIAELSAIDVSADELRIGSCVTHAQLADRLGGLPEFRALATAAERSANPQIRSVATVGGNVSTSGFAAADIATALLSFDAKVSFATRERSEEMPLAAFLAGRASLQGRGLVTQIIVPRRPLASTHVRLPLRKAGDYPVAIVSAAVSRNPDQTIGDVRISVGSVEQVPRRWPDLEEVLHGAALEPAAIAEKAAALTHRFSGRESVEAPGWYRIQVLPTLVRRAFEALQTAAIG